MGVICFLLSMSITVFSYALWVGGDGDFGNRSFNIDLGTDGLVSMESVSVSGGSLVPYDQPDGSFGSRHSRFLMVTINGVRARADFAVSISLLEDNLATGSALYAIAYNGGVPILEKAGGRKLRFGEFCVVPGLENISASSDARQYHFYIILDSNNFVDMGKTVSFGLRIEGGI